MNEGVMNSSASSFESQLLPDWLGTIWDNSSNISGLIHRPNRCRAIRIDERWEVVLSLFHFSFHLVRPAGGSASDETQTNRDSQRGGQR